GRLPPDREGSVLSANGCVVSWVQCEASANLFEPFRLLLKGQGEAKLSPIVKQSGSLSLLDLLSQRRMFVETILIWGGSSIAMYGVYLWGPTIVALLLKVSVPRAAAFFVFVSGASGVLGKIAVTLLAPALGRRRLGIVWGFGGAAALAAAGFEN